MIYYCLYVCPAVYMYMYVHFLCHSLTLVAVNAFLWNLKTLIMKMICFDFDEVYFRTLRVMWFCLLNSCFLSFNNISCFQWIFLKRSHFAMNGWRTNCTNTTLKKEDWHCCESTYPKGHNSKLVTVEELYMFNCHYYILRLHGEPCATYETGSLRRFQLGRTDTIRSCTVASHNFTKAMEDSKATREQKVDLLRNAIVMHRKYTDEVSI